MYNMSLINVGGILMLYYIRFSNIIKETMIKHTFEDSTKECGGFLYGKLSESGNKLLCDVDAIYYEPLRGNDCKFVFGLSYINRARDYGLKEGFDPIIGTYHSHGQYPAVFSDDDRNALQKYFGINKITVIYSPKYSQIVGDFLDKDGISHKAKILTK